MNVDEFLRQDCNRRKFLENSARNAAGVAAGFVGLGAAGTAGATPGERINAGVIGVRSQGKTLALHLAGMPDVCVRTVCDVHESVVEETRREAAEVQGSPPGSVGDYRRMLDDDEIDVVVVATPDHWHAQMVEDACAAGKDVYVEAPVSHTVSEGVRICEAARETGRIVQCGLQQRSGAHFRSAIEAVCSGEIGTVRLAKAWVVHRRKPIGRKAGGPAPDGIDYTAWLGPAAEREFTPNRFHHNWQWFWEYGSGELGAWGVHLLDVARWGLGVGLPVRVSATGGIHHFQDERETPDTLSVQYSFPQASLVWEHRQWSNHGVEGRSAAVAFYGDNGTLIVDRGGWKIYGRRDSLTADSSELQGAHLRDFVRSVRTREAPSATIEIGHLSTTLCHLGNIAYRVGREVTFDPAGMNFGWDGEANSLL